MDLSCKVESMMGEKEGLAKRIAKLEAQLRESKSRLKESELQAAKEKKANKELEEKLLLYKKEAVEQHEKGFHKAVRQVGFFVKDLDLGLFNPFKDVNEGVLLDEEEIDAKKEAGDQRQVAAELGDDARVWAAFVFVFFLLCWTLAVLAL